MAHKDNIKNDQNAAKALLAPEPVEVVVKEATLTEKFGHHTGCIQVTPSYAKVA
jgi:hypothetical protein